MDRRLGKTGLGAAMATAMALAACSSGGGSSDSGESSSTPPAASASSKVIYGSIQGFGSVVVNGVHYKTEDATITINDTLGTRRELLVGQMVTIHGVDHGDGTGVATAVTFDADIEGPITSIDRDRRQFTVLGQTVNVSGLTVFEDTDFATLAVGDFVEISGSFDANGAVRASSVELETDVPETVEVKGKVANLDTAHRTFSLNALTVNYGTAALEPSDLQLANGQFIEVEGAASGPVLLASEVEHEERVDAEEGDHTEVEGVIDSIVSNTRFTIAGMTVEYGSSTEFEDGRPVDLKNNVPAEVEGVIDANGVLQAEEIELKSEDERELNIRLKAPVQAIDRTARTVKLLGITIGTKPDTRIKDDRDDVRPFGLDNLQVGDLIKARAYVSNGNLVALYIERDEGEDHVSLQSPVERVDEAANMLVVEGVSVDVSGAHFEGKEDDRALTAAEFYALLTQRALIKVKGDFNGSSITATKVSLEGDDDEDEDVDEVKDDMEDEPST